MKKLKDCIDSFKSSNRIRDVVESFGVKLVKNKALCPFHKEDTPSFSINEKTNRWTCFGGCNKSGDVIDFIAAFTGKSIEEIVGYQAEEHDKILNYILKVKPCTYKDSVKHMFEKYYLYNTDIESMFVVKVRYKSESGTKTFIRFLADFRQGEVRFMDERNFSGSFNILPYLYDSVAMAIEKDKNIFFVEGEKDAENLRKLGFCATTTIDMKLDYFLLSKLEGSKIVLLGDTGKAGETKKRHLEEEFIKSKIKSLNVPVLKGIEELGDNKDVTDWLQDGNTKEDLKDSIKKSRDIKAKYELEKYGFDDRPILKRFEEYIDGRIMFASDIEKFLMFNGKVWSIATDGEVKSEFGKMVDIIVNLIEIEVSYLNLRIKDIQNDYNLEDDPDAEKKIKSLIKYYNASKKYILSARACNNAVKNIDSIDSIRCKFSQFDIDMKYIACQNVIVNIETGETINHDKKFLITKIANGNYYKGLRNELFENALFHMSNYDYEVLKALKTFLGYSMTGMPIHKKFTCIDGVKDCGKSTVFEIIKRCFGDGFVGVLHKSVIMDEDDGKSANPHLARLKGIRMAILSETKKTDILSSDAIKRATGNDTVTARYLNSNPIDFRPCFVPIMYTNYELRFDGSDEAVAGRIVSVKINNKVPSINANFESDVLKNTDGVISSIIDSSIEYMKDKKIIIPDSWDSNTKQLVKDNDVYGTFIEQHLDINENTRTLNHGVYARFVEFWHSTQDENSAPKKNTLTRELRKKGISTSESNGNIYYNGIGLKATSKQQKESKNDLAEIEWVSKI